jgi:predicted transcriptional regulator
LIQHHLPPLEEVFGSPGKVKVLFILAIRKELNITALAKEANLNHTRLKEHLTELENFGLIREKRFGRIRIVAYNDVNVAARKICDFLKSWDVKSKYQISMV